MTNFSNIWSFLLHFIKSTPQQYYRQFIRPCCLFICWMYFNVVLNLILKYLDQPWLSHLDTDFSSHLDIDILISTQYLLWLIICPAFLSNKVLLINWLPQHKFESIGIVATNRTFVLHNQSCVTIAERVIIAEAVVATAHRPTASYKIVKN